MTPNEFKRLWKACGASGEVAGVLLFFTVIGLFIGFLVACRDMSAPDVDFRWPVMWGTLIACAVPWALIVLNGVLLSVRSLLTGQRPGGGVRLGRAERKQLRRAERMAELTRRTAELERDVMPLDGTSAPKTLRSGII